MKEPEITINGVRLGDGHAMAIRAALGVFVMGLNDHGLGNDLHGKRMTDLYEKRVNEIFSIMELSK